MDAKDKNDKRELNLLRLILVFKSLNSSEINELVEKAKQALGGHETKDSKIDELERVFESLIQYSISSGSDSSEDDCAECRKLRNFAIELVEDIF